MNLLTGPTKLVVYLLGEFLFDPLWDRLTRFDAKVRATETERLREGEGR